MKVLRLTQKEWEHECGDVCACYDCGTKVTVYCEEQEKELHYEYRSKLDIEELSRVLCALGHKCILVYEDDTNE